MSTYTVEIQASNAEGNIWQALTPAENVTDVGNARDVAMGVYSNQNIADGSNWRICVWLGADADTGTEPAHILDPDLLVNPNIKAAAIQLGNMPGNSEARNAWLDAHQRMELHGYCTCTVEEILSDKLCKAADGAMLRGYLNPEIYN